MPNRNTKQTLAWGLAAGLSIALAAGAGAGIDPNSGIDFVRITHPGNAPWMGDGTPGDRAIGRGRVDYEYSIGRFEWTTAQAVEFFNAAFDRPESDRIPWLIPPTFWGAAATTPNTPGGMRWRVPAGNEMRPVGNISWRMGAIACNWYHNGKATNREAFLNGAYDVGTFGTPAGQTGFSDQATHSPGARYWLPTWDELLKASHYDPDRGGAGVGGWWVYNTSSDQFPTPGQPGVGQANYGFRDGTQFTIPLGAYDARSPWGLYDTAGATSEWTEDIVEITTGQRFRRYEGSYWSSSSGSGIGDAIVTEMGDDFPEISTLEHGLRIASNVPAPSAAMVILGCVLTSAWRKRPHGGGHETSDECRAISRVVLGERFDYRSASRTNRRQTWHHDAELP